MTVRRVTLRAISWHSWRHQILGRYDIFSGYDLPSRLIQVSVQTNFPRVPSLLSQLSSPCATAAGRDESAESGWLSAPFPQGTFDLEQTSVSNNR